MNSEQHRDRSAPRGRPGFGRRFLAALLAGADEALRESRREEDERAAEDDVCRLWPAHSRLTRGYEDP